MSTLETLRRITQEVNSAQDMTQVLGIIVRRVKQAMAVEVCSAYLADTARNQWVLMASDGLNPNAVGRVRLNPGEGLVSVVVENAEPLNLDNATDHPRYLFIAQTGEEYFHAFLGVPVIHHRKVLGVLVVRQRIRRRFDEEEVAFLITIAAQLSGAIAHAEVSGGLHSLSGPAPGASLPLDGLAGAPGVSVGTAMVVYPAADLNAIPDRRVTEIDEEIATFQTAVLTVIADVQSLGERLSPSLTDADRALFDAYRQLLGSRTLIDKTIARIRLGSWASGALRDTIRELASAFDEMDDPYLRERADDLRDLGQRVLVQLQSGRRGQPPYPLRTVLIGEEITATMLAEVPRDRLVGVVSARGSGSSHAAILARALGIPAVVGVNDLPVGKVDGCEMIVDGHRGRVYLQPTPTLRDEYLRLASAEAQITAGLEELRNLPAITPDGVRIPLYANTGLLSDIASSRHSGAEGIGLYRSEIPFMIRERFPSEEEQRLVYRQVLEAFAPRPVTLRTLDVGGDKALPYFPIREDNPFLGWRGIRITLDHPEIFLTQLRAMLRASQGLDNLQILLPMISGVPELDEALRLIQRAYDELTAAGEEVLFPSIGIMVEVPSAVYQIDALARRVDFVSVGTNDLTQYLLAVDRNNTRVAAIYDSYHPAVLRALMLTIAGAHHQHKPVSVCGELAGDPAAALLLLGMGVDSLSMSVAALPRVKWVIRRFTRARAQEILSEVLALEDGPSIHAYVKIVLEHAGLGRLGGAMVTEQP